MDFYSSRNWSEPISNLKMHSARPIVQVHLNVFVMCVLQVIDAVLHLMAAEREGVMHINCVTLTSIFRDDSEVHDLMRNVKCVLL